MQCRRVDCDIDTRCSECTDVSDVIMSEFECFLLALSFPFSLLLLSALNDLTGPSAGPMARIPYSIPFHDVRVC